MSQFGECAIPFTSLRGNELQSGEILVLGQT